MKTIITETEYGYEVAFTDPPDDFVVKLHAFFDAVEKKAAKEDIAVEINRSRKVEELDSRDLQGYMKIMGFDPEL